MNNSGCKNDSMAVRSDIMKLLLPIITVVLIINVVLLTDIHRSKNATTLIVQEVYNKLSDGHSKSKHHHADSPGRLIEPDDNARGSPDKERIRKASDNGNSAPERSAKIKETVKEPMKDSGIDAMINKLKGKGQTFTFPSYFWNASLADLTKRLGAVARKTGKTLAGYKRLQK